jgi:hypothetical protein
LSCVRTLIVPGYGISVTLHYSLSPFSYCYEYTFIRKVRVHSLIRWPVVVVVVCFRGCSVDRVCFCKILLEFTYSVIASTVIISSMVVCAYLVIVLLLSVCVRGSLETAYVLLCRMLEFRLLVLLSVCSSCFPIFVQGIENRVVYVNEYFVHMYVIAIRAVYMECFEYVHVAALLGHSYYIHRVTYIDICMYVIQYMLGVCRGV